MRPLTFPKAHKLRKPGEFKRVYDGGAKAGDGFLLAFALPNGTLTTRVGLSVSRKHGGAVRRNRVKRLLREAFRLSRYELPAGFDVVLIPRVGSGATLDDYRGSLKATVRRAVKRLPPSALVRVVLTDPVPKTASDAATPELPTP